ncbi:MAG: MFS transporter [Candidatus Promineifilaceae bacterium]|nr:MFS transporter [Candidatus Promineifilaceae bacterium]
MNDKREIRGWTMYDWANSAFSTTVVTTFLGPYLLALAQETDGVTVLGFVIEPAAIFPLSVSISVVLQVIFLPLLGAIADYSNLKKRMMLLFAYLGAAATIALFFVEGDLVLLGGLLLILANLAFGAALVFYNAFLPEIASPDRRDQVSARGFGLGYLGGGLLLLLNLILFNFMEDSGLAVRISLASAGVWWLLFTAIFPQRLLVQRRPQRELPPGESYLSQSVKQLRSTLVELIREHPMALRFLIAYLIYNDGIQTVIVVSSQFAADELGVDSGTLALLVLMIQFVAFPSALAFGWLAGRTGAKRAIMGSLVVWSGIVIFAFAFLYEQWQLWILGGAVALVLGGSQALSRSLFSQMIPSGREAEYFGLYEISERGTSWIGPLVFGIAVQMTGTQRVAIVSLIVFFLLGLALLSRVDVRQAMAEADQKATGVVI